MAVSLSQALAGSAAYFAAEPAAVSAVYEVQLDPSAPVEFAAIRRHPEAGSVLVTVARTEELAQAALERASVAGRPIRPPVDVIGRELVLETTQGPALVRVGGPASVGWNSASYPCEVLAPADLAGSVWTAPAADVYAAAEAADREAAAAASPVSR